MKEVKSAACTGPTTTIKNQQNPTSKTRAKKIYGSNTKAVQAALKKTPK